MCKPLLKRLKSDDNPKKSEKTSYCCYGYNAICVMKAFTDYFVIFYSDWNVLKHETPSNF